MVIKLTDNKILRIIYSCKKDLKNASGAVKGIDCMRARGAWSNIHGHTEVYLS
mgnify:CR=1 FL=1